MNLMVKRPKSRISDDSPLSSPKGDITIGISDVLREARLRKQLSQQELAAKLGLGQRQISDLERATIDARLSTIQDVARALDLELMLVPRHLISAVDALQRVGSDAGKRPLYALSGDDSDDTSDESPQPEVGDTGERSGSTEHQHRGRRGPQR